MPELRQDPLSHRWVVISMERAKRPHDFKPKNLESHSGNCVFCEGNEDKTPPEIFSYRESGSGINTPGWWVRTVPNKFPALGIEGSIHESVHGLNKAINGVGAHEVIIESPEHRIAFFKHPLKQVEEVIRMWRDRHLDLRKDNRLKYVLVFKNEGPEAGASLEHSHSQLMALPMIPKAIEDEINIGFRQHVQATGRCICCDMVAQEANDGSRIAMETEKFIAFCPFASRFPFETWIVPKQHESDFGLIKDDDVGELAWILREVACRLSDVLGNPPYNMLLHSTPVNVDIGVSYHWHIEILPRLTTAAGFEYGTEYYINPTPPEIAAESIRAGSCHAH
ncbi:MAG: galactose-1-phosphate uridylyltransferase [Candidatus Saccharibacteria bacterium]